MDLCTENEQGNALSALNASVARLTAFDRPPAKIQEASNLLASAQIQIEEAMNELNRFVDHFEADPERQQAVQERLDSVYSLARKHRVQPEALLELHEQLRNELQSLDADDVALERLQEELTAFERHYQEKAGELSRLREQRAPELAAAVETEMQRLGMPGGRFSITLTPGSTGEPQPLGNEGVEFRVSANPGQPLRPLAKVASGGELSGPGADGDPPAPGGGPGSSAPVRAQGARHRRDAYRGGQARPRTARGRGGAHAGWCRPDP